MSGFRAFTRQLGQQPGVQLNPIRDNTDGAAPDNSDQVIAAIARLTRGPIDRTFRVNRSNLRAKTGDPEALRVNPLNECKLQVYEALYSGAVEAVLSRLVPAAATKSFAVVNFSGTPAESANTVEFTTATIAPSAGFSIYLMHHNCHNDGIKIAIHADKTPLSGASTPAKDVKLRVLDSAGQTLHEFEGSLDQAARDESGKSRYLPDVVAEQGPDVEVWVATNAAIPTSSNAYGRSLSGNENWAVSQTLSCFNEGGTVYTEADFDRCITALRNTRQAYGYLITGGTKNVSLIGKLASLAAEINTPLKLDIDGTLSWSAAVAFAASLNLNSHYVHVNWAPIAANDPMNGGKVVWGAGGAQAGFSCARNARLNAKGFAPKNYPIAGKDWPLSRVGITQLVDLQEPELSDLAKAQINPVIQQTFNAGSLFVFSDSLTSAKSYVSQRKLQSVAEMSLTVDNWITLAAREFMHLPMDIFIKKMTRFMEIVLHGAQTSGWLKPAAELDGAAYAFTVQPSQQRPADLVLVDYWTSYDGVARQVIVQQTLTK